MKNKTLVKAKIVLEDNGTGLVIYLWKRTFWKFGYWYPFGSSSSNAKVPMGRLAFINDNQVSKALFEKFIASQTYNS